MTPRPPRCSASHWSGWSLTGQWWLEVRSPGKDEVAAHLVNLAWNGLSHLEHEPLLRTVAHHGE